MSFGERLKNLRLEKGLTQEDVANEVCVTKQAVWKWEHDVSLPDIASLERIAQFFGVNIDYLLTGNDNVKIEEKIVEVEKEKLVEVEKEVVKEKIVEVEKQLTEEERERMLYKFRDIESRMYALYFIVAVSALFLIISIATLSYAAIVGAIGLIMGIIGVVYSKRLYKKEKEKLEELNIDTNLNKKKETKDEKNDKEV